MKLSDTDFPREVRERMEQVLLPGEEILWAGSALPGMKRNLLNIEVMGSVNPPKCNRQQLYICW